MRVTNCLKTLGRRFLPRNIKMSRRVFWVDLVEAARLQSKIGTIDLVLGGEQKGAIATMVIAQDIPGTSRTQTPGYAWPRPWDVLDRNSYARRLFCCFRKVRARPDNYIRGGKSTRKNPPKIKKFIWTSFSEQFPLGSWLVSQGRRQKFARTFRKSSCERGVFFVFRDFGWIFGLY